MAGTTLRTPTRQERFEIAAEAPAQLPARPALPQPRLFTVDEFRRMDEAGILGESRLELIEGEILVMSPIGSPHAACVDRLNYKLPVALHGRAIVRVQGPIFVGERSMPQPDLSIFALRDDFYQSGHPRPEAILFVIEVMDSSVYFDRNVKLPLYAAAGIREVWQVDLAHALLEVYRRPLNGQYAEKATFTRGQQVAPEAFPDVVLDVDLILGRAEETP